MALFPGLLSASAALAPASSAGAQQASNGNVTATAVPRGLSPASAASCTADAVDAQSEPGYQGTYSVTDRRGGQHSYSGPLSLTIGVDVYQDPQGTFDNAQCAGNAGFSQPIRSASLTSPAGGTGSLTCSYDPAQSTYSRHGQDLITVVLVGTCAITQGGVSYVATTHETHQGRVFERNLMQPQPPGTVVGMGLAIRWSDAYSFSTTCVSASCDAPGPPGASGMTLPGPGPAAGGLGPAAKAPSAAPSPGQAQASAALPPPSVPGGASPAGSPVAPGRDSVLHRSGDEGALDVDTEGAGWGEAQTRRSWPRPLVALALLTLGIGEVASYRKQKRAGRPVFPLLSRLRKLAFR